MKPHQTRFGKASAHHVCQCISVDLNSFDRSVTSPTVFRAWNGFPSALRHASQGVISVTSCWGSTAADASAPSGSAGARTWCTNRWSTRHSPTSCRTSRWLIRATGTRCVRWRSAITCHTTPTAWSRSSGNIRCWTWTNCPKRSWRKSWTDTLAIWGWR